MSRITSGILCGGSDQLINVIDNEKMKLVLEECDPMLRDISESHRSEPWKGEQKDFILV